MELYAELLLSALLSILLAFLLSFLSSDTNPNAAHMPQTPDPTPSATATASDVVLIERVQEPNETKDDDDDGWEKFERSEAADRFREAAAYMASAARRGRSLASDAEMRLFALHKVATEGPCCEPPPMPFKLAARARWNAWQKLGIMNPEVAMEKYVTLVTECIPGWAEGKLKEEAKDAGGSEGSGSKSPDFSSTFPKKLMSTPERSAEGSSHNDRVEATDGRQSNQGLTKTFIFNLLSPTRVTFLS